MNPFRPTILTLVALLLASVALPTISGVKTPPLPGQVRVTNQLATSGGVCAGSVTVHYRANTIDTAVSFATEVLSNCTTRLLVHEIGGEFTYLGGAYATHQFNENPHGNSYKIDIHEVAMSAVWTGVNPSYPCPTNMTWAATVPVKGHDVEWFPSAGWWNETTDGICATTSSTTWADALGRRVYVNDMTMSTGGDVICRARLGPDAAYSSSDARIYHDDYCVIAGVLITDPHELVHSLIGEIAPDESLTFNIHR